MRRRARELGPLAGLAAIAICAAACAVTPARVPGEPSPPALELPAVAARAPAHLLLVSVQGLVPEAYLGRDAAREMPTLAALARAGVAAQAVQPVFPSAAYPAHTTLVTGRVPARHGVASNRMLGERGVRAEVYGHASHVRAITLWQAATDAGRATAALDWPATAGASVAALLPDLRPRRRGETWPRLLADAATPWLFELAVQTGAGEPAAGRAGPARDAVLGSVACSLVRSETPPGLLLLRFSQTEAALRRFGPGAPEVAEAFRTVDGELGDLIDCLRAAGRLSSSALVVVGDHGTLPVHTALRPNAYLAEVGLVVADKTRTVSWRAIARSNGGSAFVYARDEQDALLARRALQEAAQRTQAFRILSAEKMLALGADPEAWFGLEAEPGYVFDDAPGPSPLGVASVRGSGGYLPARREMAAGLVAWGAGFRRGVLVPTLAQTDVAPTLARLLGLRLGAVDGRVLVGVLDAGVGGGLTRRAPASRGLAWR